LGGIVKVLIKIFLLSFSFSIFADNYQYHAPYSKFIPTIVKKELTMDIFEKLRTGRHFKRASQCYNRAHIQSFELNNTYNVNSLKVWVFFTDKYQDDWGREAKWWFHIAPAVITEENKKKSIMVMDTTFFRKAVTVKEWTDRFVKSKYNCPQVYQYSDWYDHQYDHDCYIMITHQFFWQPRDIEALYEGGAEPYEFGSWRVDRAYKEAVKSRYRRSRQDEELSKNLLYSHPEPMVTNRLR
jgi:hypothetical protein